VEQRFYYCAHALHIGASGWIFGLWSLCIATAWYDRKFINIVIGLLVVFLYGGMLFGVLPGDPRVSFESHFFGAIAGVVCAFFQAKIFNNRM
jgi:membrane associated rhomboid family serine protease